METKDETKKIKAPSFGLAVFVMLVVIIVLMGCAAILDINIQIGLFICIIFTACVAIFGLHYKWEDIQQMMMDGVMSMLIATFILLLIGTVIASWIASGTIPAIIYYGLKIINPKFFLLCACLAAAFMSMACGSSWSSAGTVGIAFMGIGAGLGINPAMTAGAIVSGAYFGDKQSPFSDTTNLASALSGTTLFEHISSMLWTTTPSLIITLILYTFLGFSGSGTMTDTSTADLYINSLEANFNLNPVVLLPIVVLIYVIVKKAPAIPGLVISSLIGGLFAVVFQHANIIQVFNWMFDGYTIDSGAEQIDKLLNRGGLSSMLWTVSFYFMACILGQILSKTGILRVILEKLAGVTKSVKTLIPATLVSSFALCAFTGSLESAMVVTSNLFKEAYDELHLDRKVLSRSLEDAGTMLAPMIPWNSNGVFMATTLGVATLQYIPYAFLGLFTPVFSIICAMTGIGIFYTDGRQTKGLRKKKEA